MSRTENRGKAASRFSRRGFLAGAALGAAGTYAATALPEKLFCDPERPPWISEYYVNGFWIESAGLYQQPPNPPLLQTKTSADLAIIGGGFTGLASAYHLAKRFPAKKIILLEAARCGYGASGRNGGQVVPVHESVEEIYEKEGPEAAQAFYQVNRQGLALVKELVQEHGLACDLESTGILVVAVSEQDAKALAKSHEVAKAMGRESRFLDRDQIRRELATDRYWAGWRVSEGAIVNPAKLAKGMKALVQALGVEVFEQTKVMRLQPGAKVRIETEFGEVTADAVVIGTNGYSHALGLFRRRIAPLCNYVIATEPLSPARLESLGWKGREAVWDTRTEFDYMRLSADNRIVIGGEGAPYFYHNGFSTGNYKPSLAMLEASLLQTWPQLQGVRFTHRWGGTMAFTLDFLPSIGVMGDAKNIYYGVGYSGEGLGWAQLAGKIIGQLYAREQTELTKFSLVNRTPPYLPPDPLRYLGINLYKRFF